MPRGQTPSAETLLKTIHACAQNGSRLTDESYDLEFRDPPSLQLYVLLIAQEEYAKAFILYLILDRTVPFNRYILRAMNDHACKQLVGLIMDYIIMRWDTMQEAEELINADVALGDRLPPDIESAVLLLRFEKIGRWESHAWNWNEPPSYDLFTRQVAAGKNDRRKQDALYIRIAGDGRVSPTVRVTRSDIDEAKERLSGFRYLIESLLAGNESSYRFKKALAALKSSFAEAV